MTVRARVVGALGALAMAVTSVSAANAASVGGFTAASLVAYAGTGKSGAPTVYASDNFTGTSGSSLNGRNLVIGSTWAVAAGTWTINSAGQAQGSGVPLGRAVTTTFGSDVRITATVYDTGQAGRTSGLVMRSDPTATRFLYTWTQNGAGGGRIFLAKYENGTSTTLASARGVGFSNPSTYSAALDGPAITITYNGTVAISYTLSAADQATFGSLISHGLLNDNAGTVRYDDFRVETLT